MDQICCLLGLCCVPAQRQETVTQTLIAWGCEPGCAPRVARELTKAIDDSQLGQFLKYVKKHDNH